MKIALRFAVLAAAGALLAPTCPLAQATQMAPPPQAIVEPVLVATPTPEALVDAYPLSGGGDEGVAEVGCDIAKDGALVRCAVNNETPLGRGFGEAAIKLARSYTVKPRMIDGAPAEGGRVRYRIRFKPSPIPADRPWWTCPKRPSSDRYYPDMARHLGKEGRARIRCRATATAILACVWISEEPDKLGFGEAAAKLGCLFELKPEFRVGATIEHPVVFETPIAFKLRS